MTPPDTRQLVIVREFEAPRQRVYAAWTDEKMAGHWWVPKDFVPLSCRMDVRVGGAWHRRMRSPSGGLIVKFGVYREVDAPRRLVFTYRTENADGGMDPETLVALTLVELEGERTRLTLWHTEFEAAEARDDHRGGWTGCMQRFGDFLEETA